MGRTAEKQGRLLDARQQYLASQQVLFTTDAEKGLERIAEAAGEQVSRTASTHCPSNGRASSRLPSWYFVSAMLQPMARLPGCSAPALSSNWAAFAKRSAPYAWAGNLDRQPEEADRRTGLPRRRCGSARGARRGKRPPIDHVSGVYRTDELEIPPSGPGARRHINNYIAVAEMYGGIAEAKLGKESTTAGETFKMVYNIATIGLSVTAVMFGDFFSMIDVATGVNELGHEIALSQRQVKRLATDQRLAIRGAAFKATPAAPVRLTFRTDLD